MEHQGLGATFFDSFAAYLNAFVSSASLRFDEERLTWIIDPGPAIRSKGTNCLGDELTHHVRFGNPFQLRKQLLPLKLHSPHSFFYSGLGVSSLKCLKRKMSIPIKNTQYLTQVPFL
jgi:hypothetical protein